MSTRLGIKKRMAANFVAEVEQILKITGWSQAELSRRIDVAKATVTNWLSGKTAPDGTARYTIADVLRRAKDGEFNEKSEPVGAK